VFDKGIFIITLRGKWNKIIKVMNAMVGADIRAIHVAVNSKLTRHRLLLFVTILNSYRFPVGKGKLLKVAYLLHTNKINKSIN